MKPFLSLYLIDSMPGLFIAPAGETGYPAFCDADRAGDIDISDVQTAAGVYGTVLLGAFGGINRLLPAAFLTIFPIFHQRTSRPLRRLRRAHMPDRRKAGCTRPVLPA